MNSLFKTGLLILFISLFAPCLTAGASKASQPSANEELSDYSSSKVDSLLNSITIDTLTNEVYNAFTPPLNLPFILGIPELDSYKTLSVSYPGYYESMGLVQYGDSFISVVRPYSLPEVIADPIPQWFKLSLQYQNEIRDAHSLLMIRNPQTIEFADWNLPVPPRLPKEDYSFQGYLKRLNIPALEKNTTDAPEIELEKRHWLHNFNVALQISQAYVSANWYQGGNSYVSGLFNFNWNVELNKTFHPNLLFQSSLQYKLAVNSNPKGSLHKYNTSQDLFQYNLKSGFKAFNHWFYSLNLLFNTQIFNNYPEDSKMRSSAFLSPGTFNLGLGMTYTLEKKNFNMTVSISPLAYNLKTCIYSDIDHAQYNIPQDKKSVSEIGSSAEANFTWKFSDNISWKSRFFVFTDYSYFLADWENTFNFQINRFLSTQIYLHPRFDSSSENNTKWHHWMLHEILSFGISYTFATPR